MASHGAHLFEGAGAVRLILAIACVAMSSSCGEAPGPDLVERLDSAGVEIITNLAPDRPLGWTMDAVGQLGGKDEGPEAFFRVRESGIGTDSGGRLYVLDQGKNQVDVFDRDGVHVRTMAREGQGPGELASAASVFISEEGEVSVFDSRKRAFVRFSPTGSFLGEDRLPESVRLSRPTPVSPVGIVAIVNESLSPAEERALRPGDPLTSHLMVFEPSDEGTWTDPVTLASLDWAQPSFTSVGAEGCPFQLATPPVFTREPVWTAGQDRVVYNSAAEYRFDVTYLNGDRVSIRRALPVVAATRELAAAEIGSLELEVQGVSCDQTAEERADQAGWTDQVPWIKDIALAPDGSYFVLRRAPGEEPNSRVDVFDRSGEFLGTLPPGFPLPLVWRGPDEIVQLELDDFDRALVVVYRVTRG